MMASITRLSGTDQSIPLKVLGKQRLWGIIQATSWLTYLADAGGVWMEQVPSGH